MSFTRKKINLTFKLGQDTNGVQYTFDGKYDTVTVTGLRIQATIANAGGASMGEASVIVHGLSPSLRNQLSNVNRAADGRLSIQFNQLTIEAGDDIAGMSRIFQGQISQAVPDFGRAPDVSLVVTAHGGLLEAVKMTPALSFPGSADAAVIMQNLATENGYTFENNGVSVMLSTPYFPGSPKRQMEACANAANINWSLDNGTLAIWPKGGSRGGVVQTISPETGMIGYPAGTPAGGVLVRTLFNPHLHYGAAVQVESSLPFANGKFVLFDIAHDLESETPNGQWETSFSGSVLAL
ncbi:baseplate hub protein [Burkholderia sp. LMG 21824]|uniref:baseplate hub protein n=1 Tax=Burkholderia sp. LMG 21824 TaxID=3158172 RepID=UPI003C2FD52A